MKFDDLYDHRRDAAALLWALPLTLLLTISSSVIGNILAVPVAVARLSPNPLLWVPARVFIFMMRGTPFLIQALFHLLRPRQLIPGWMMRGYPFLKDGIYYAIFALSLNTAGYTRARSCAAPFLPCRMARSRRRALSA